MVLRTGRVRSEEHTSELQSRVDLVCRLLLEKKNWPACWWVTPALLPASSPSALLADCLPACVGRQRCTASLIAPCFTLKTSATTVVYTLSLHDALPISSGPTMARRGFRDRRESRPGW